MAKTIGKTMHYWHWEIGKVESWFTHMSKQGLHLVELKNNKARFEHGEEKRYKYRMLFGEKGYANAPPEHFKEFEELGWEYVCENNDTYIFRSLESLDLPEIQDPQELANELSISRKKRTKWVYPMIIIYAFYLIYRFFIRKYPILRLVDFSGNSDLRSLFLLIYVCCVAFKSAKELKRLELSLSTGVPIDHNEKWEIPIVRRKLRYIGLFVIGLILLFLPRFLIYPYSIENINYTLNLPYESIDYRVIRLADIENDENLLRRNLGVEKRGVDYGNYISTNWSPFAPLVIDTSEHGVVPNKKWVSSGPHSRADMEYQPILEYVLYQFRFSWMADVALRELLLWTESYDIKYFSQGITLSYAPERIAPSEVFDHPQFDRLFIREETVVPEMHIIATKGNYIVRIKYIGEQSLEIVLIEIEKLFDRLMA
ncbi:MAG: DUF2812 domain-containing protein [Oscillospiraceae bacterium]|nr:DUF2812 domain-containing protein [Oscillospiraceae bacterium]